jgi:anti-anti-sigma factor
VSIVDFPEASAEPSRRLRLRVQPYDGYTIISIWGELQAETIDELRGLLKTLHRTGCQRVLLDLSRLYDIDTDSIAELSRWQTVFASSAGGCLWLAAPRPWVRRLIEHTCLRGTFNVYPTMAEALAEIAPAEIDIPDGTGYPRKIRG